MDRASIYFIEENEPKTYDYDETLPPLPLPELHETLQRYYDSLRPFSTEEELAHTRKIITHFKDGVGKELQAKLRERANTMKNWLEKWWDAYGYHLLRFPLNPYTTMAMPVKLESLNVPESPECLLKNLARIIYHTIEFWDLLRQAKLKPLTSHGGQVKYSSVLYKRFFSTTRVPGVEIDHIDNYFRTVADGPTPTHCLLLGKGRIFTFETLHPNGILVTPPEILLLLQRVRTILDFEPIGDCVPVLTHDNRTNWAKNRQQLIEISADNKHAIKLIESSSIVFVFDENEPKDYEEISQVAVNGDFHSKWADRSSTFIAYRNGKFSCVGEHSAYDGTISVSYGLFIELSLYEEPEPIWNDTQKALVITLTELKFVLNDHLNREIKRMLQECDKMRTDIIIAHSVFDGYGKDFMKPLKLHPDSFVQVIMQLTYTRLHNGNASTYETALMRHYYNGRTETLRSCTNEVHKFLQIAKNANSSRSEIQKAFYNAVHHHNYMMNEARNGHGVDRHLFGLWCAAYENKMPIPEFYEDPLYAKSGGGGNFVLSTSTLGYTMNVGFVAPMTIDGYGVFYSITSNAIHIISTAYRASKKTSSHNFIDKFIETLCWIKDILEDGKTSKL